MPDARANLNRLLTLAHERADPIPHDTSAVRLYADAARAAEQRIPGALGEAIAGVLALAAYNRGGSGLNGVLGEDKTTLSLALAVLELEGNTATHDVDVRPMTEDEQRAERLTPPRREPWLARCTCGANMLPLLPGEANSWAQGHLGTRPVSPVKQDKRGATRG